MDHDSGSSPDAVASARRNNRILAALPDSTFDRIAPGLEPVTFEPGDRLVSVNKPMRDFLFITRGVACQKFHVHHAPISDVVLIGNEGGVGLGFALGGDPAGIDVFAHSPTTALRMRSTHLQREVAFAGDLSACLFRFAGYVMSQVACAADCSHHESVREAVHRWIALAHERVADTMPWIPLGPIADTLGADHSAVGTAAEELQRENLVECRDGGVRVTNPHGISASACACTRALKADFERLVGALRSASAPA